RTIIWTMRTRGILKVGRGITLAAESVWTTPDRINFAVAACVFINLGLSGIHQHCELGIKRIARIVNDRVAKIRGGNRSPEWKVCRAACIQRDRVLAVLKKSESYDHVDARHDDVSNDKIAVGISRTPSQIECVIGCVTTAIKENQDQSIQRGITDASVIQFDKLGIVDARSVRIKFVDTHVGRRRWGSNRCRPPPPECRPRGGALTGAGRNL